MKNLYPSYLHAGFDGIPCMCGCHGLLYKCIMIGAKGVMCSASHYMHEVVWSFRLHAWVHG